MAYYQSYELNTAHRHFLYLCIDCHVLKEVLITKAKMQHKLFSVTKPAFLLRDKFV